MSLDKAIIHKKEKRKPYTRAKAIAKSCRNHGDCPWCRDGRLHNRIKAEDAVNRDLRDFLSEGED